MHQITAFGSSRSSGLFRRAILQSPASRPASDAGLYRSVLEQFLIAASIPDMSGARSFSSDQLQALNTMTVGAAPFASYTYGKQECQMRRTFGLIQAGPSVDGDFVPSPPTVLLSQRRFDNDIDVIVAHNSDEGILFTDSRVQDEAGVEAFLTNLMPSVGIDRIRTITTRLYPQNFTGRFPYTTETERLALMVSEALVTCNANAVLNAFDESASGYLFSLAPGIHAQDVGYTFYNGQTTDFYGMPLNEGVAGLLQSIIVNFAQSKKRGVLDAIAVSGPQSLPNLPLSRRASILNVTGSEFQVVQDPAQNSRCEFWQTGLFSRRRNRGD